MIPDLKQQDLISKVMRGFINSKYQLVEYLFGDSDETYKAKWLNMDGPMFWCHLDLDNRQKTIDFFMED